MEKEEILEFFIHAKANRLTRLDLSNREIREIPNEVGELIDLEHLDLSYNYIERIPPEIGKLTNLKSLLLLKNEIRQIPPEIGNLKNLVLLDISHNRFTDLPPTIGFLTELKTLDASYGLLKRLPLEFIYLLNLRELYLEENPFEFPPVKVIKRGLYATMHYLTAEKKKLDASKVVMQIFNMPESLQKPFRQYLGYFNDIISSVNEQDVYFDIKFIQQKYEGELELKADVTNYLYDFLLFIQEKIEEVKHEPAAPKLSIIDLQIAELRKHIDMVSRSIDQKVDEIKELQNKLQYFIESLNQTLKNKS
ncbi:MAG TPA: leucine-rich repeat domain-containing protein [Salinivirgaceae bacterium]|nr:leucine-rich repeat domain-containing protein [Salinivirgaceae bacterium]